MQATPRGIGTSVRIIAEAVVKAVIDNLEEMPQPSVRNTPADEEGVRLEMLGWEAVSAEELSIIRLPSALDTGDDSARFFRSKVSGELVFDAKVSESRGETHFSMRKNDLLFYSGPLTVTLYLMLAEVHGIPVPKKN